MFRDSHGFSGFSSNDIPKSKQFYSETLGLEVTEENGMLTLHLAGGGLVLDLPEGRSRARHVHRPELPGRQHRPGGRPPRRRPESPSSGMRDPVRMSAGSSASIRPPIAWFKDPAGNILSVLEA